MNHSRTKSCNFLAFFPLQLIAYITLPSSADSVATFSVRLWFEISFWNSINAHSQVLASTYVSLSLCMCVCVLNHKLQYLFLYLFPRNAYSKRNTHEVIIRWSPQYPKVLWSDSNANQSSLIRIQPKCIVSNASRQYRSTHPEGKCKYEYVVHDLHSSANHN